MTALFIDFPSTLELLKRKQNYYFFCILPIFTKEVEPCFGSSGCGADATFLKTNRLKYSENMIKHLSQTLYFYSLYLG